MYEPAFEPLVTRIILPVVVLTLLVVCELGFDFVILTRAVSGFLGVMVFLLTLVLTYVSTSSLSTSETSPSLFGYLGDVDAVDRVLDLLLDLVEVPTEEMESSGFTVLSEKELSSSIVITLIWVVILELFFDVLFS